MNRPTLANCCATTPSALCLWTAVFGLSYGAAVLLRNVWPPLNQYGNTAMLTALATACFVNFGRNGTLHCAWTGPLFLGGAIVALLTEAGTRGRTRHQSGARRRRSRAAGRLIPTAPRHSR